MYESPIEIIQTQMQMQMDGEILKAVQGVGINVDKEELIKALAYDREQYSKGYKDGAKDFAERLRKEVANTWFGVCCTGETEEYKEGCLHGLVAKQKHCLCIIKKLLAEMVGEQNA